MIVIAALFGVSFGGYYLLITKPVQNLIAKRVLAQLSARTNSEMSVSSISIHKFRELVIRDLFIADANEDTLIYAPLFVAQLDSLNIGERYVMAKGLEITSPVIKVSQDNDTTFNFTFLIDSLQKEQKVDSLKWNINLATAQISNGTIGVDLLGKDKLNLSDFSVKAQLSDSVYSLDQMSVVLDNGFELDKASAKVILSDSSVLVPYVSVLTPYSSIILRDISVVSTMGNLKNSPVDSLFFILQSNNSMVGGKDIDFFLSDTFPKDRSLIIDGGVKGDVAQLEGKGFKLKADSIIDISCDFYVNNINNDDEVGFNLNLRQFEVDVVQAAAFCNEILPNTTLDVSSYAHWEKVSYQGFIAGDKKSFNTNGEFTTPFGSVNTDLFISFLSDSTVDYEGRISTPRFQVGSALQRRDLFGGSSANLFISGGKQADGKFRNFFNGEISDLSMMGYQYSSLFLDGSVDMGYFNGHLMVNDPNLKFDFVGEVDFASELPLYHFLLDMEYVDLAELNLTPEYEQLAFQFKAQSKLEGSTIDNLDGFFAIDSMSISSEYGDFATDSVNFLFKPLDAKPSITFNSEYFRGNLQGDFDFSVLPGYINYSLSRHLSDLPQKYPYPNQDVPNMFRFNLEIEDIEPIATVFDLPVRSNGFVEIEGEVNSKINTYAINAYTPYILTDEQLLDSVVLSLSNDFLTFESSLDVNRFMFGGDHVMDNVKFTSLIDADTALFTTFWENESEDLYSGDFSTKMWLQPYGRDVRTVLEVQPSEMYISNSLWHLNRNRVSILPSYITVDSLKFYNGQSHFMIDGVISENLSDTLSFGVSDFQLENLAHILNVPNLTFGGDMSGSADLFSVLKRPVFEANINVSDADFNESKWGDLKIESEWDSQEKEVALAIRCEEGEDTTLSIAGIYHPQQDSLVVDADFNVFSIEFLRPYLRKTLSNLTADASGHLDVRGSLASPELYGGLRVTDGGFGIDYISVDFATNDTIYFDKNKFVFKDTKVQDQEGNVALVNGSVTHTKYKDMLVDLIIQSDRLLGLNTTAIENEYFYGDMYIGGAITIKSTMTETIIGSRARTMEGSMVTVPLSPVSTATTNNFISYVVHEEEVVEDIKVPLLLVKKEAPARTLIVDMNFDLTTDAAVRLEFDAKSGDVIDAVGKGNLNVQFQHGQPFQMFGEYNIVKGKYMFTLQQLFNKPFDILSGSSLRWSGSPGDAIVDINAHYATRASLYNLMPDAIGENNKNRRVPVNVKLMLDKKLSQPDISFDIELPNTDQETQQSVSNIIDTEEEMSRQVLSLLIMNNFYTPEYYNDANDVPTNNNQLANVTAVTVSEFLSNQLSSWMSQISDNVDLGFRYIPEQELTGQGLTPEEYEMAISTQFFNDRVTVNGNVGYQDYAQDMRPPNLNSNFVGEVDVEVKLNERFKLKAYSHQNDDILYENSSMKQGAGISYQEDFSSFKELRGRYKERFGRIFKGKDKANQEAVRKEDEEEIEEELDDELEEEKE